MHFRAKHIANIEQLLEAPQITDVSRAALKRL
jgi:hypothetical protein